MRWLDFESTFGTVTTVTKTILYITLPNGIIAKALNTLNIRVGQKVMVCITKVFQTGYADCWIDSVVYD